MHPTPVSSYKCGKILSVYSPGPIVGVTKSGRKSKVADDIRRYESETSRLIVKVADIYKLAQKSTTQAWNRPLSTIPDPDSTRYFEQYSYVECPTAFLFLNKCPTIYFDYVKRMT